MPDFYFLFFDILVTVVFAIFILNAVQKGSEIFWLLAAGLIYGILLEWATIEQLHTYHYSNRFPLRLRDVRSPSAWDGACSFTVFACFRIQQLLLHGHGRPWMLYLRLISI